MPFNATTNMISVLIFMYFLSFTFPSLGPCNPLPKDTSMKSPMDLVWLEIYGIHVAHPTLYHWATQDPVSVANRLLHPSSNKPLFLRVCSTGPLKTLREKEKLLVTSNFSFSHSVFYPF